MNAMKTPQDHLKEFGQRFKKYSDKEIVGLFNLPVGKLEWDSARGAYLAAIHKEFIDRESIIVG
jgi:hypothetical protein